MHTMKSLKLIWADTVALGTKFFMYCIVFCKELCLKFHSNITSGFISYC